jgi:glutathione synthase/RimK-type ligase-like ATP-grasp enzyme
MSSTQRVLNESVRRYAEARGLDLRRHADGWILELAGGEAPAHFIYGYDLGLNTSSSRQLANDKSATFEVLDRRGIAAVEHRLFLHPRLLDFVAGEGNWRALLQAFDALGGDVVVKDNEGTGGMEVFRVRSVKQLEQRVHALFQVARGIALSPFLAIETETRFVLLDGVCRLAYRKERAAVTGDGRTNLAGLIARDIAAGRLGAGGARVTAPDADLAAIPAAGVQVALEWRHNLGQGARAVPVDANEPAHAAELDLARRAMAALGLRFASVDVVAVAGAPRVLEINAGVMLEVAAATSAGGTATADGIYHAALDLALAAGRR